MKINQTRRRPIRKTHSPNHTQDSQGPDGKIRGTSSQIFDRYMALARDATSSGDRVSAESFYQYADHYYRLMSPENENTSSRNEGSRNVSPGASKPAMSPAGSYDDLPSASESTSSETSKPHKSEREQRFDTRKSRHPYVSGSNRHHNNERVQARTERVEAKPPVKEPAAVKEDSTPPQTPTATPTPPPPSDDIITVIP